MKHIVVPELEILLLFHEFEYDKQINNASDDWLIAGRGH